MRKSNKIKIFFLIIIELSNFDLELIQYGSLIIFNAVKYYVFKLFSLLNIRFVLILKVKTVKMYYSMGTEVALISDVCVI